MTTLDELLAHAAQTDGPSDDDTATARRRFLGAIAQPASRRRWWWRRGVIVPVAVTFLAGGLAAGAAAGGLFRLPSHGEFQGGERKTAVEVSPGRRVELWAAQHPGRGDCPMLRLAKPSAPPDEQVWCTLFLPEKTQQGLSANASLLPPDKTMVYGRVPDGATKVVAHVADGTSAEATIGNGWYLAATPATDQPVDVEALGADGTVLANNVSLAPAVLPGLADCAAAAARPRGAVPSAAAQDRFGRRTLGPPAIVPMPDFPGGRWDLYLYQHGHDLDVDNEVVADDGSPIGGGGSGFGASSHGLTLGWGTLTGRYDEASGAAPEHATCVVLTDTLGRRFATPAVAVPGFAHRTFWGVVFVHDAPLDHVTAYDASGRAIDTEHTDF